MNETYWSLWDMYLFNNNGCRLRYDCDDIIKDERLRGDGTQENIRIDMISGDINLVRTFYKDTYISKENIIKKIASVTELELINNKEKAIEFLLNSTVTIDKLISKLSKK